jgi:hypothetical protein
MTATAKDSSQTFITSNYVLHSDLLSFFLHQHWHSCLHWLRHSSIQLLQQRVPKARLENPQSSLRLRSKEQLLSRPR